MNDEYVPEGAIKISIGTENHSVHRFITIRSIENSVLGKDILKFEFDRLVKDIGKLIDWKFK